MSQHLNVNGLEVRVVEPEAAVLNRVLDAVASTRPAPGTLRSFTFLAGPPGSGKSTLAEQLRLAGAARGLEFDVVGLDGFHYRSDELTTRTTVVDGEEVGLATVKGAPESFDLRRLAEYLERSLTEDLAWPVYDRRVHDVVDTKVPLNSDRVLIEGNWLLLDEPGWQELRRFCALSIFLTADPALLRDRLIARKIAGGLSRPDAEAFYTRSDSRNVGRCLDHTTTDVNLTLRLTAGNHVKEVTTDE